MAVMNSFYCVYCDNEIMNWYDEDPPECCGEPMRIMIVKVNTPEWGSPRTYIHLRDEPFGSRSELDSYAKEKGYTLENDSAEKVGGARRGDEKVGNLYFDGKAKVNKSSKLYHDGPMKSG